jgi:hypothetical protein
MRKRNVFGKKVDTSKPLYYLLIIFALTIFGYIAMTSFQTSKLLSLKEEQSQIQTSINNLLYLNQESSYRDVDELLPYLPNSFSEAILYNELQLVKNLSGLATASQYQTDFENNADSPFSETVDENLRFVKIEIVMEIDDYNDIFDYIDNLDNMERLYYIDSLTLSLLAGDSASISLDIYTFYIAN